MISKYQFNCGTWVFVTVSVDTHDTGRDVSGDSEIRQPQVFDVCVTKCAVDGLVEV